MKKVIKLIISFLFLLVFLTACEPIEKDYKITARDGQVYHFAGNCIASRLGGLTVNCYKDSELVLSVQATSFEILKDEE